MHFRTLESRIVTLFLVLVLAVQLGGFFVIRNGIVENAQATMREQLRLGENLFNRLLEQKKQRLTDSARVLAKDTGFRSAIGTDDRPTIESGLITLGERIDASLTLLVGLDRQIKATTVQRPAGSLENTILSLIDQAEQNDGAVGISIFDNRIYQVLVVPVRAPVTIGWIAMAFPLDDKLAQDMRGLSSLEVSFLVADGNGSWLVDATTFNREQEKELADMLKTQGSALPTMARIEMGDSSYSVRTFPLTGDKHALVVLQRSLDAAIAPYKQLQYAMMQFTAALIVVAVIMSFFAAKRIAGPLRELTETAKRLGSGKYEGQIAVKRDDEIGKLSQAFNSMRDDIAKREVEIRRLAYWDTLTNLPNRAQFALMLNEAIATAGRQNGACFILMMNLDRIKNVNDVLGHHFGDLLLRQVAHRLTDTVGPEYPLARLGGDEFAVLLSMSEPTEARTLAAKILKALETPISLDEQTVDLGAGIGISGFPAHGADAETLLSRAEVAMYEAKLSGNEAVLYEPGLDRASQESLSLLSDLRRALDRSEFKLFVQPKLMLGSGEFVGLEALVRWQHPEKGMIFPDYFIPFSEKTGFIRMLTRWMLEQSAMLCSDLSARGIQAKISVNLSARDLLDQDLPRKFSDVLNRYGVNSSSFCLEITESSIMDDPVRAQSTLEGLHALGVELSIDDFGTGYSSLAYLKRLPVHELKIDKSFVMNMERDADDAKIVRSTIDLGHNMGLRVVAEGVESEAVWSLLARMGCDQGQGYFMSRPIPAEQLPGWVAKWTPPGAAPLERSSAA
ncbi:MAG TPA: EAL domain-containing protein [Burkholderiaceae bacterium]